jgi:hypothetical protein
MVRYEFYLRNGGIIERDDEENFRRTFRNVLCTINSRPDSRKLQMARSEYKRIELFLARRANALQ